MKNFQFSLSASILVLCLLASMFEPDVTFAQQQAVKPASFAPDRVLVAFYPGTSATEKSAAHSQAGGRVIKTFKAIGIEVVSVSNGKVLTAIEQYKRNPNVKFAETQLPAAFVQAGHNRGE